MSERDKTTRELNEKIKEALKTHSKEYIIKTLEGQKYQYLINQMFATKGGILGTPNYDKLQMCIDIIENAIKELQSEK